MLNAHTGAIVITNGRSVSLAECEWLSNARKTSTVPKRSSRAPTANEMRVQPMRERRRRRRPRIKAMAELNVSPPRTANSQVEWPGGVSSPRLSQIPA
jgi:hypothetical protein